LGPVVQYKSGKFTITKDQLDKIYTPVLRILDTP
jgi:hypothetical protein